MADPAPAPPSGASFDELVEAAPIGLMTVDAEGCIVLLNRQIEQMFGYARGELLGEPIEMLIPERYRRSHPKQRQGYIAAPSRRNMGAGRDLFGRRKDGSEFLIEIGLNPQCSAEQRLVHCSIVDVTERKARELELKRRVSELQKRRIETELLGEMSSLLQHALDEDEALDIISSFGARLFPGLPVGIYIMHASENALALTASWGGFQGEPQIEPTACWALRRSQLHRSGPGEPARCRHTSTADGQCSTCIPMSAHGQWLGMVTLGFQGAPAELERRPIEAVGRSVSDQFGLAISNLKLRKKLRILSLRDGLTGLYNRRYLEETAERELHRAQRRGRTLAVLMLDVDHFKAFNDQYGHQFADEMLRRLSATLTRHTCEEDVVCRYGGEEFVLLLPEMGLEEAEACADRLRLLVFKESDQRISCSIGVSVYPRQGRTWSDLLRRADEALYTAKRQGRNQVVCATERTPTLIEPGQQAV